jgi:TolB protein
MKLKVHSVAFFCILLFISAVACRLSSSNNNTAIHPTSMPELPRATSTQESSTTQHFDILYSTHKDGSVEIFGMQADGSNPIQLTFSDYASNWHPDWSPDCSSFAFDSDRLARNEPLIYIQSIGSDQPAERLVDPEEFLTAEEPSWSPDGNKIAFCGRLRDETYRGIFVMNADGSQVELLTDELTGSINTCPAWSPDGQHIAFLSSPQGRTDFLMVINADGTNMKELYNMRNVTYGCPSWSPDSNRIAFVANNDADITDDIAIINADGSNFINLTNSKAEEWEPDWSPDGQQITYMFREGGSGFQLRSTSIDGTETIALTDDEVNYHYPDWCSQR